MDHKAGILVVEDEWEIRRFVKHALEGEGYRVFEADTMARGLIEASTHKPELIILDLGLPDGDGLDLIRSVRAWSGLFIVVLSARVDETDKVEALDLGANDYLGKPFGVTELLARVRAALRRQPQLSGPEARVEFGNVSVDLVARRILKSDVEVHLTQREYHLLLTLLGHPGRVLTHRQLLHDVWGPSYVEHSHYLRIYMGHLRHKLEDDPTRPRFFLTETGVGYRFLPDGS
ncbi:MAG TPA: two-component system response regulator KdpE [Gammaproteobacteria bacterium]|nr:two-component system response regulator KdpE [Gammaproteobacteria bacterium]